MKKDTLIIFVTSSILITLFLFFIDEGYYNFKWMTHWGNWVAFVIYVVPIFLAQVLVYRLIPEKYRGRGIAALSILIGVTMGILFVVKFVFVHVS